MAAFHQFDISKFQFPDESKKREDLVQLARVAEAAERYEDMCKFVYQFVQQSKSGEPLTVEERNLMSVAYKNVIGSRRASWRTLTAEEHKNDAAATTYRKIVEAELQSISDDVLGLLNNILIPATQNNSDESQVFFLKMAGDYNRYTAEFAADKGHDAKAAENYKAAMQVAEEHLAPTHPIRLGLALNYSVCQYEILRNKDDACALAKKAFDDAISKLDQLDEASYKDSTLIMQLLRDNLTLWTSEPEDEDEE